MGLAVRRNMSAYAVAWPRRLGRMGTPQDWYGVGTFDPETGDFVPYGVTAPTADTPPSTLPEVITPASLPNAGFTPVTADQLRASATPGNIAPGYVMTATGQVLRIPDSRPAQPGLLDSASAWLSKSTVIAGTSNSTVLFGGLAAVALLAALSGGKRRR
jgi:hypothetical protein